MKFNNQRLLSLFFLLIIFSFSSCDKDNETIPEEEFIAPAGDCISLCSSIGTENVIIVPVTSDETETCECECEEGFYGDLCNEYYIPTGLTVQQIKLTMWPELNNNATWDVDDNTNNYLPDPYLIISSGESPNVVNYALTQTITNLESGTEASFAGNPFPIFLPLDTQFRFDLLDDDLGPPELMTAGLFTLEASNVLAEMPLKITWSTVGFEIEILGSWEY